MILTIPASINLFATDDLRSTVLAQLALDGYQHGGVEFITLNDVDVQDNFSMREGLRYARLIKLNVTVSVDTNGTGLDATTDVYALDMEEMRHAASLNGWEGSIHDWSEAALRKVRHMS